MYSKIIIKGIFYCKGIFKMLQAFEFNAIIKDGKITLPDEYKNLVKESVKVIIIQKEPETLLENEDFSNEILKKRQELLDFARKNRIKVNKLEIPGREERNAQ